MTLGQALRQLRMQKKITLAELAEKTDSFVGNLSRIERDLAKPSLDLLYRVSEALDYSMSEIFSVAEPSPSPRNPEQVSLNTIFVSLLENDQELLLDFAKLLQERANIPADEINVDAKPLPVEAKEEKQPKDH